jgi:hypothetical protein
MNQWTVSLYLSKPKAAFAPNCESVTVEEAEGPNLSSPTEWKRSPINPVADQWSLKMPPTVLISTGLTRRECATVTECRTPSRDFCQNPRKTAAQGNLGRGRSSARRSFAAARDGQGAGTGYSPWLGRTLLPASENLARSRRISQVLEVQVFHRSSVMATSKINIVWIQRRQQH